MSLTPQEEAVVGHWVHAHEEDDSTHRVFRRQGALLPPSRGRAELVIGPDLTAQTRGPGADDRLIAGAPARITFHPTGDATPGGRVLRVSDVSADRLRVLKD